MLLSFPRNIFAGTSQPELEVPAQISRCASGAGGRTCQSESGPNGLARRASAANATNESGSEAEIAGGMGDAVRGRDAEFTERSRGGSQRNGR